MFLYKTEILTVLTIFPPRMITMYGEQPKGYCGHFDDAGTVV